MIDRNARNRYATILRHLATGNLSTDAFESEASQLAADSPDPVVQEIHVHADGLYHDLWPYRLRRRNALNPGKRRAVARMILLLRSDEPGMAAMVASGSSGPFGWLDLLRVFWAILTTIFMGVQAGLLGLAVGIACIARCLFKLHFREIRWTKERERAIALETIWPFADQSSLDRARGKPLFLCGSTNRLSQAGTPCRLA